MSSTFLLCGLMSRCEESAMFSNLSMNSMAKMPDMPEPMARPSVWRNIGSSKVKYMLWSATVRRSVTCCLGRWSMEFSILLTALSTASWMGMDVYRDTTSKLQGCGNDLLVVRSPARMHLMSSKLFSRCAGTFLSMGSRAVRFIHARLREHLNNDNPSVKKHTLTCQRATNNESNDVKIIAKESDPVNLRLFEAFYIRKYKPEFNS